MSLDFILEEGLKLIPKENQKQIIKKLAIIGLDFVKQLYGSNGLQIEKVIIKLSSNFKKLLIIFRESCDFLSRKSC